MALQVEVVSASEVVWSGEASNIVARTTTGDIGVLPGHVPLLALLEPSGVEIFTTDNNREIVAVGSGFISVDQDRVTILSEYARMGGQISLEQAERALDEAESRLNDGAEDHETRQRRDHALAQVKAARKAQ